MEGFGFWARAVLAAVVVGMSKGGLPVVGMLGVPILSLAISPVTAAGLLLPVYVLSDMFGLYAYRHAFDRRVLAIMLPATTLVAPHWKAVLMLLSISVVLGLFCSLAEVVYKATGGYAAGTYLVTTGRLVEWAGGLTGLEHQHQGAGIAGHHGDETGDDGRGRSVGQWAQGRLGGVVHGEVFLLPGSLPVKAQIQA